MFFRTNVPPWYMPPWTIRQIRSNYHALHVLRNASPKLRKAILSSCDTELVNTVSECALNVLRGNLKLANRHKHRLQKFKDQLRSVVGRRVAYRQEKTDKPARRISHTSAICYPTDPSNSHIQIVRRCCVKCTSSHLNTYIRVIRGRPLTYRQKRILRK